MTASALDRALWITRFDNLAAVHRQSEMLSLRALKPRLLEINAAIKDKLPLLKLASFGDRRTPKNSLRFDTNVREIWGIEGDYDAERLTPEDLAEALHRHRVAGLVVTSPSHREDAPRARLLLPCSTPLKPAERARMISRLAGIIPDDLAAESWTLSQAYFIGRVGLAPRHRVLETEGAFIDLRPDLDATAKPKPPVGKRRLPAKTNGAAPVDQADLLLDAGLPLDVAAALDAIAAGEGSHDALVRLAGRWTAYGLPRKDMQAALASALQRRPDHQRDEVWHEALADLPRLLAWIAEREAEAAVPGLVPPPPLPPPLPPRHPGAAGPGPPPPPPPPHGTAGAAGPGPQPSPSPPPPQARTILRNKRPKHAGNLANVITLVLQAPELAGCVVFDEMVVAIELRRTLPGSPALARPRPWTDDDTSQLQDWLQRTWDLARLGRDTVQQGIEHVARLHGFHPVREYLDGLAWDGTPRLDTWLHVYLGVENAEYAKTTGRMWLIGMVARIMRPGCKFDYMLILEGLQGTQKSRVCCVLCGPWVSDQSLDIRHDARAASQHLRGKWLVEVSELTFFRSADVESLKAFISRTHERYLPRYAHNEVTEPRQCGFLGTTNNETYLHDPTGGRRFWPHRTGTIAISQLRRDRDQLWAEAVHAYRAGDHWWPTPGVEQTIIRPEQLERYAADAWIEPLGRELARREKKAADERKATQWTPVCGRVRPTARGSLIDIWQSAFPPTQPDSDLTHAVRFERTAQMRVRDVLLRCGWRRAKLHDGYVQWEEPY